MKNKIIVSIAVLLLPLVLLLSSCGGSVTAGADSTAGAAETTEEFGTAKQPVNTEPAVSTGPAATTTVFSKNNTGTTEKQTALVTTTRPSVTAATEKPKNTATLKITCADAVEYMKTHDVGGYESIVPANGIMLDKENIEIRQGESVLDLLKRTAKDNSIIVTTKVGQPNYVLSINGLAAADGSRHPFGTASGWLYFVNGTAPRTGANSVTVQPGDVIEFRYVTQKVDF